MSTRSSNSSYGGIDLAPNRAWLLLAGLTAGAACLALLLLDGPAAFKAPPALALAGLLGWEWRTRRGYRRATLGFRGGRFLLCREEGTDRELTFLPQSVIGRHLLLLQFSERGSNATHGFLLTAARCGEDWRALRRECLRAQAA